MKKEKKKNVFNNGHIAVYPTTKSALNVFRNELEKITLQRNLSYDYIINYLLDLAQKKQKI